jgi:phosphopantetheine--protein transferase-like protein
MKIGIDTIQLPNFKEKIKTIDIAKIFSEKELIRNNPQHLAGIFAAKEAFFKAIGKKIDWLDIEIEYDKLGKPTLKTAFINGNTDLSISHDGDTVVAVVILF